MPKKAAKQATKTKKPHFGERLAEARRSAKLTQGELADKADIHISHVQRIEAGTSQPTVDVLKRLAEALTVSLDFLVFDRTSEAAAQRLADSELIEHFAAVEHLDDDDKQAVKKIIAALIVKQRVEAAVR
jgi:transcriptional regulator with XRE-family HTH domain